MSKRRIQTVIADLLIRIAQLNDSNAELRASLNTAEARLELLTIRDGRILAVAGGDDYRQRLEKELADAYGKVKALEDALRRDRAYVSAGWELFH